MLPLTKQRNTIIKWVSNRGSALSSIWTRRFCLVIAGAGYSGLVGGCQPGADKKVLFQETSMRA